MDLNQHFFKHAGYYPLVYLKRQNVPLYLNQLLESQYLNEEQLANLQLKKLKNLVAYASKHVQRYKNLDVDGNDIKELIDISLLPYTTKAILKTNIANIRTNEEFHFLTQKTTGGSTGEPITILKTPDAMARELAATWRGYSWAGIDIGDRQGRFWGVPFGLKEQYRSKIIDFVCNRRRCSAFSFTEIELEKYTKKLQRFKPSYFYGYVSMLCEYAKYIGKTWNKSPFKLKCIIPTSELLTKYHRGLLKEVFKTKVFNEYGCGEVGSVAHECQSGSMHIMAENMIVEIVDGDRNCSPGEIGEIVITELNNYATPLIRYRTGDYASFSLKKCSCGRMLPVIDNLFGRAYDTVKNKEGRLFHGEFFMYIFEEAERKNLGIEAFQVIQRKIDYLEIRIVINSNYSENTANFVREKIWSRFDRNATIEFIKVNSIKREKSGKMRVVVGLN